MTGAKAYQKRYAKARQRCRRTAAARLQRDHRQAQHVVKVLERALHDFLDVSHIFTKSTWPLARFNLLNVKLLCRKDHDWWGAHPNEADI